MSNNTFSKTIYNYPSETLAVERDYRGKNGSLPGVANLYVFGVDENKVLRLYQSNVMVFERTQDQKNPQKKIFDFTKPKTFRFIGMPKTPIQHKTSENKTVTFYDAEIYIQTLPVGSKVERFEIALRKPQVLDANSTVTFFNTYLSAHHATLGTHVFRYMIMFWQGSVYYIPPCSEFTFDARRHQVYIRRLTEKEVKNPTEVQTTRVDLSVAAELTHFREDVQANSIKGMTKYIQDFENNVRQHEDYLANPKIHEEALGEFKGFIEDLKKTKLFELAIAYDWTLFADFSKKTTYYPDRVVILTRLVRMVPEEIMKLSDEEYDERFEECQVFKSKKLDGFEVTLLSVPKYLEGAVYEYKPLKAGSIGYKYGGDKITFSATRNGQTVNVKNSDINSWVDDVIPGRKIRQIEKITEECKVVDYETLLNRPIHNASKNHKQQQKKQNQSEQHVPEMKYSDNLF